MVPLLTFASGLLAGIVGVRVLKGTAKPSGEKLQALGTRARDGLEKAQNGLRSATISGLEGIERSSAHLRDKLTPPPAAETAIETAPEASGTAAATTETAAKPKPRRRRVSKPKAPSNGGDQS